MDGSDRVAAAEELARAAADSLPHHHGPQWDADLADVSLYHGRAGVVLALHEAHAHLGDPTHAEAVERHADALADGLDDVDGSPLYFGLTGVAFALHALGRVDVARCALALVRDRSRDGRWGGMFELLAGNAGIGLGALLRPAALPGPRRALQLRLVQRAGR